MSALVESQCSEIDASREGRSHTRKHIRGSTLLLAGRLISLGINFTVQVLLVRYLAKSDFGAFAYALSIVALGSDLCCLGLDKGIGRFAPIYCERRDYTSLFGTIAVSLVSIVAVGGAVVAIVIGMRGILVESLVPDAQSMSLLLVLIALAPVEAIERLLTALVATFGKPGAIFFRRHLLGPGLKLATVLLLIGTAGTAHLLAIGYLLAGVFGAAVYAVFLVHEFRRRDLWQHRKLWPSDTNYGELFRFSLPLLSSDLVALLRGTAVVIMLGYFHSSLGVAEFKAVLPIAGLNKIVLESFRFLFIPAAARMFARGDREGINQLYWQTTVWISIFSLPIFLASFAMAQPLTVFLFGSRYEGSASVLTLLSLGYFCNAALGFNVLTLRVFGNVRTIVLNDLLAVAGSLLLSLLLIPAYGPLGGAIASCSTLVLHNALNQIALLRIEGMSMLPMRHVTLYGTILLAAAGLLALQHTFELSLPWGLMLALAASLAVFALSRQMLEIQANFPELERVQRALGLSRAQI